jgi:septum formation topological specificity factor MinE
MSGAAMQAMKEKIVDVVREFAEVDDELGVEVSMSQVRVHVASLSTTYQYTSSHTHQS